MVRTWDFESRGPSSNLGMVSLFFCGRQFIVCSCLFAHAIFLRVFSQMALAAPLGELLFASFQVNVLVWIVVAVGLATALARLVWDDSY